MAGSRREKKCDNARTDPYSDFSWLVGADLEAEGGGGGEQGGRGAGEMDADGGKFAAVGGILAEAVEAAAEIGGVGGGGHFGAPGAVVIGDGAGGGEQVG